MSEITLEDSSKKYKIILLGLAIHLLLLSAVFDVYFSSPIDHGMEPILSTEEPPAQRLVLFVADGLRSEAVFSDNTYDRTPFLTDVINTKASWGVAHTRVPTESRPGHVALLAGIFEDPSAILKGWKSNPVDFDSVVNRSNNAWCIGSPDIVNIFNKDNFSHIHVYSYDSQIEDFGKEDTGLLDTWVYEKLKNLLENCNENCQQYHQNGNLFFLHLLGIDTAGHGYKPKSKEYTENIKLVDSIVKNTYNLFEKSFKKDTTTYIFTSDHGMTDWGSHGSGSTHETEVPFAAWGSGIKINKNKQNLVQINIAPLISSLIGVHFPTNSLGIVPANILETSKKNLARIYLGNALQILELFNIKRKRIENNALIVINYEDVTDEVLHNTFEELWNRYRREEYDIVINKCKGIMEKLIIGLDYYHNYYKYPILLFVSTGFLFWIFFLMTSITDANSIKYNVLESWLKFDCIILLNLIIVLLCYKQKMPIMYYLYFSFPFLILKCISNDFKEKSYNIFNSFSSDIKNNIIITFLYFCGIELLIYGFFNRSAFSILIILIGIWIYCCYSFEKNIKKYDLISWSALCLILAIFPSLPVMKTTFNTPMIILGCFVWLIFFYITFNNIKKYYFNMDNINLQYKIFYIQFFCFIISNIYILLLEYKYISPDSSTKYISWPLLLVPILLIPLSSKFVAIRLATTFFAFAPFYSLVSSNYELIFSSVYVATLSKWMQMESDTIPGQDNIFYFVNFNSYKPRKTNFESATLRRSFLFITFVFVGFFGTGNIASLNSFDPMWVRAFLTVFSPFKMTGLILLKIMVPFVFACCVFRAINFLRKENVLNTFCAILVFSDLMVLQFLYLIKNVGSWLDIGTSLSHFMIMEGFVMILLVLYGVAHVVTTISY